MLTFFICLVLLSVVIMFVSICSFKVMYPVFVVVGTELEKGKAARSLADIRQGVMQWITHYEQIVAHLASQLPP